MTPAETIQPYVTSYHRLSTGLDTARDHLDFEALFRREPDVLAYARAEITRLTERGGGRVLAEHDHESRVRCAALRGMIEQFEGHQP